ncbi:F0F1 ATP synthase subunit epsilon [bacterium]|nr:F0F1 ATP synthase subunit epsilon [bacterium]
MPFKLEVISPDRVVFAEDVDFIAVRGVEGELGILPSHTPLFTKLNVDLLTVHQGDKREVVAVMGGFLDVQPEKVTILTDAAERASEIDAIRARQAKERAEIQAGKVKDVEAEAALHRAVIRLKAVDLIGAARVMR